MDFPSGAEKLFKGRHGRPLILTVPFFKRNNNFVLWRLPFSIFQENSAFLCRKFNKTFYWNFMTFNCSTTNFFISRFGYESVMCLLCAFYRYLKLGFVYFLFYYIFLIFKCTNKIRYLKIDIKAICRAIYFYRFNPKFVRALNTFSISGVHSSV